MSISLAGALRLSPSACIAFTGAGGKTTALVQLARQLPSPVIVTATTHLGAWQTEFADRHIMTESSAALEDLEHGLKEVVLVTGEMDGDRTRPISDHLLDWLHQFCGYHSLPLLIEADGARQKPLKAWNEHEPPIPGFVEQVIQVVGLSGLGKPLNAENVHRPAIFSELSGLNPGEIVTAEAAIRVLTHSSGGLKNIPAKARKVVLLNQADTPERQSIAHGMSHVLLSKHHSVIVSSLIQEEIFAVHEPIAGIVLAAGESSRFGEPKQLLDWKGQAFVRAVAQTALEARLSPVIVVTGSNAGKVEAAVYDLNVKIVRNENWKSGQGSSIRSGIKNLEKNFVGGVIFLLADQPQVTTSVLRALVEKHAQALHPIVAPMVMDQRANPVLFDRATFSDLLTLEGDVGGRAIFHKHRVEYLPWQDDRLLLDVDTVEMYQRLIANDPL
jgi:molybdenum cofactor cytidylyltransferase